MTAVVAAAVLGLRLLANPTAPAVLQSRAAGLTLAGLVGAALAWMNGGAQRGLPGQDNDLVGHGNQAP